MARFFLDYVAGGRGNAQLALPQFVLLLLGEVADRLRDRLERHCEAESGTVFAIREDFNVASHFLAQASADA